MGFKTVRSPWLPDKYLGMKVFELDYSFRAKLSYLTDQVIMMVSGRWFTRNIEYNLADCPEQIYDRLMSEWQNLGE